MNSRERMAAAMDGREVDRAPILFFRHFPGDSDDNCVKWHVDWVKASGMDGLIVQYDTIVGFPVDIVTDTIEDFKHLKPLTKDHWYIRENVERVARILDEIGDETAIFGLLYTAFNMVRKTMHNFTNMEMRDMWRDHKAIVKSACDWAADINDLLIDEWEKVGAFGCLISFRRTHKTFTFGDEEFRAEMLPYDKRVLDHLNAAFNNHNVMHICGDIGPNGMEPWLDLDYHTVQWDIHTEAVNSLAAGREFWGPEATIMGGFNHQLGSPIYTVDKEGMKEEVRKIVADAGGQRKFILSSDCSVKIPFDDQRYRWMIEALEELA